MRRRGVVRHEVDDQAEPQLGGLGAEGVEVVERAEERVDVAVVGHVVAGVLLGRRVERRQPDGVDAEVGQGVEAARDPGQVADPVAVAVGERAGVDLVDDGGAPPLGIEADDRRELSVEIGCADRVGVSVEFGDAGGIGGAVGAVRGGGRVEGIGLVEGHASHDTASGGSVAALPAGSTARVDGLDKMVLHRTDWPILNLLSDLFPENEPTFPLALGTNVFGWTVGAPTALEILDEFAGDGGRVIDTADVYSAWLPGNSGGESEAIIGRWLARPGNRDRVIVSTKVGQQAEAPGLTRASIRAGVEASLTRLRTDRIDLYFAHFDDDETPLVETVAAFSELVDEGKIRYPAASNYSGARVRQALAIADSENLHPFAAVQTGYNLVRRDEYEQDVAPIVDHFGLAVLPHSSLASGFLTGKYRDRSNRGDSPRGSRALSFLTPQNVAILEAMDTIADRHAVSTGAVAVAWLASRQNVVGALASARSVEQLDGLLAAARVSLDASELDALTAISAPAEG